MNLPPRLPELDDLQECDFEREAARFTCEAALRALADDLDDPLRGADFEAARAELDAAQTNWTRARHALRERQTEFARLGAALGERELADLRARLDHLGFGGDDFDAS